MKMYKRLFVFLLLIVSHYLQAQKLSAWKLIDLQSAIDKAEGPTIFNFWATFCKPCLAELPHFQQLAKKYQQQGVKLILVSLDLKEAYPTKIKASMKKFKFSTDVFYLNETDADKFCPVVDSSWSGVIPATLLMNRNIGYRKFFEEELSKQQLEMEIKKMLKK